MATYETIEAEIKALYMLRPHLKINVDQVKTIALLWLEDLEEMPDEVFIEAVKVARRGTKFFPTTCEVLEAARKIEAARYKPPRLGLPACNTDDEREAQRQRNVEGCERMKALLAKVSEGKRIQ